MPKFQYVKTGDFEAPARFKTKGGEVLSGLLNKLTLPGTLPDRVDYILKSQMACEAIIYSAICLIPLHKKRGAFPRSDTISRLPPGACYQSAHRPSGRNMVRTGVQSSHRRNQTGNHK